MKRLALGLGLAVALTSTVSSSASAQVRGDAGYTTNVFPGNDDGSVFSTLGFIANFYGSTVGGVYLNNNGNITFNSAFGSYNPTGISAGIGQPVIAPFWQDVDTRGGLPDVTYGNSTVGGNISWGANWLNVGRYSGHATPTNTFQLVLVDRSDIAVGDFDFEFNYGSIGWQTADVSPTCAEAGWNAGDGDPTHRANVPGSGTCTLNDGNTNALEGRRFTYEVRSGQASEVTTPEPASLVLLGTGLVGVIGIARRRRAK